MRTDIEFDAGGTTLRGWLYQPQGRGPFPIVVMAHGFSAVKEHFLDNYAELFAASGIAALVYDHANFGASDGEPRGEIDPWRQIRDYRHAISFARTLPVVDRERIGVWGSSYSGGHVLVIAALDQRVRCAVAQVPFVSGEDLFRRLVPGPDLPAMLDSFVADREARHAGGAHARLPVVAPERGLPCALVGPESWEFFDRNKDRAPGWINEITMSSVEMCWDYEPGYYAGRISPTPLLLVVAERDTLTPTDTALALYERLREPKQLVLVPGGHFDAYVKGFDTAGGAARDWFVRHLGRAG
ncbi:MAG: alpha/beta hydrolase [Gammaproteobacteria bacterium]|nr:alpha/beta hydrolase [Gammaproteobacteria bacterium]